jgi:hypothetical protein
VKVEQGVMNAGILIDTIRGAVLNAGAVPETEIRVRIGKTGPVYNISSIKAQKDQRGLRLLIETEILPDLTDG